jgi:hypothetical protein
VRSHEPALNRSHPAIWYRARSRLIYLHCSSVVGKRGAGGWGRIFPSPKIGDGGGLTVIPGPFSNFCSCKSCDVHRFGERRRASFSNPLPIDLVHRPGSRLPMEQIAWQLATTSLWNGNSNFELSTANSSPEAFLTDSFGKRPPASSASEHGDGSCRQKCSLDHRVRVGWMCHLANS